MNPFTNRFFTEIKNPKSYKDFLQLGIDFGRAEQLTNEIALSIQDKLCEISELNCDTYSECNFVCSDSWKKFATTKLALEIIEGTAQEIATIFFKMNDFIDNVLLKNPLPHPDFKWQNYEPFLKNWQAIIDYCQEKLSQVS